MANFRIFSLVFAVLAFVMVTSASSNVIRLDDIVTLDKDTGDLQFNPIDGLNETTQDPAWQKQYLKSLDPHVIIARHYEEPRAHLAQQLVNPRIPDQANVECFQCMLTYIMVFPNHSKQYAFGVCFRQCASSTLRGIANNAGTYAATKGYIWQVGNAFYNAWAAAVYNE